jgi:phage anti-repressor protein
MMLAQKSNQTGELKLADKKWDTTFAIADMALKMFDEGMPITDIAFVMNLNPDCIEGKLKLAKAFPQGKRWKDVGIDIYTWASQYPNPQQIVDNAWNKNQRADYLREDFKKFRGEGFPVPVPARVESQTPIEILLDVDEDGITTAQKLYAFLTANPNANNYSRWVKTSIEKNKFAKEGIDFEVYVMDEVNPIGGRPSRDYKLTATFAKKLAMVSQTENGEAARDYYVRVEQNAKDFANGKLDCISPQGGAMRPMDAAKLILETADRFKDHLPRICLNKMIETVMELRRVNQLN